MKIFNQFKSYSMIGVFSIIIDFGAYILLTEIFIVSKSLSKIISFILASINSFLGNKLYTFKLIKFNLNEPLKFLIVYILSLFINSVVHDFFYLKYNGLIPFGMSTLVSIIINFFGLKYWVFKN